MIMSSVCFRALNIIALVLYLICSASAVELDDKNSAYPAIWHVPHRNENFIGRSSELKDMASYFQEAGSKILPLTGRGGIGKTQLAKQYTHLYKQNYDIIWWFDAKTEITSQFKALAEEINARVTPSQRVNLSYKKDEAIIEYVKDYLRTIKINWLLIFDDTKDIQGILPYLPDQHADSKGHIIITSRNNWAGYKIIKLTEFLRHDSIQLIECFLKNETQSQKEKLADQLGDYPLAIVQAISYISVVPSVNVQDYLQLYNSERVKLWEKEQQILAGAGNMNTTDNYNESAAVTLIMTMQEIGSKNEQALKLLKFCSMFDNENIPLSIMQHYITDQLVLNEAIAVLVDHNILELKNKTQSGDVLYRMHEMIKLVIQDKMTSEEKKRYLFDAANTFNKLLPTQLDKFTPIFSGKSYFLDSIKQLIKTASDNKTSNKPLLSLYIKYLEFYLSEKRDYDYAQKIFTSIERLINYLKEEVPDNLDIVRLYVMQSAYVEWVHNDYMKAIIIANKALELLKNTSNTEEEYVMVYNRLVNNYYALGELDKALLHSNAALEYIVNYQGFLGNKDAYYQARSKIFLDMGKYDEAFTFSKKALHEAQGIIQDENLIGYYPLWALHCRVLLQLGRYDEAYEKLSQLYQTAVQFFQGEMHQFPILTLPLLAFATNKLKSADKAEQQINQAIDSYAKLYGADVKNRHTAYMHTVRGDIYAKQNKYDDAQEEYFLAEEIYKTALKNTKIDDVSSLYIKISINAAKRKDPLVTKYYFDLHKETFGEEHQRNFELIMYLTKNGLSMP